MADKILEIRHLSKAFGTNQVLRDIDFTVDKGDVISIIGCCGTLTSPWTKEMSSPSSAPPDPASPPCCAV